MDDGTRTFHQSLVSSYSFQRHLNVEHTILFSRAVAFEIWKRKAVYYFLTSHSMHPDTSLIFGVFLLFGKELCRMLVIVLYYDLICHFFSLRLCPFVAFL